uniref:Glycosyl-hydrolase 97 C-terminal oligomerisation domain-containing protein n=1 Tax=Vitrella brassicaformis TaxID=1169539 RepID=A0A7S1P049_9ALVE
MSKSYWDVIAAIPTTWDETRALPPSVIGTLTVLARRKGDTWYIGIVSGVAQTRTIKSIPLDFLDSNKSYSATFLYTESMSDAEQDDKVAVKRVRGMNCTRLTNVRLWGEGIRADGMVLIMKQMGKRAAV